MRWLYFIALAIVAVVVGQLDLVGDTTILIVMIFAIIIWYEKKFEDFDDRIERVKGQLPFIIEKNEFLEAKVRQLYEMDQQREEEKKLE